MKVAPAIRFMVMCCVGYAVVACAGRTVNVTTGSGTTSPEITAADLRTRLYLYADDSMMGRKVGTPGNTMATRYIESEVRRMGLEPAGDSGTFFQGIHPDSIRGMPRGTSFTSAPSTSSSIVRATRCGIAEFPPSSGQQLGQQCA